MWDRLRSATVGGGGGGDDGGASPDGPLGQGRNSPTTPLRGGKNTRASTLPPPTSASSNSAPSWQPRSSVLAAQQQQGRQQQQQQQQQPQQLRQVKAGPPPPRPPRQFEGPAARPRFEPSVPPRTNTLPPSTSQHYSYGDLRPASSVYSQPSPLVTEFGTRAGAYRYAHSPDEVSPPSSPEDTRGTGTALPPNPDISPIDEEDRIPPAARPRPLPEPPSNTMSTTHAFLPSQQRRTPSREDSNNNNNNNMMRETPSTPSPPRSSIPMIRRERRAQRDAEAAASASRPRTQQQPVQVRPLESARGLGISTVTSMGAGPVSPERERQGSRSGSRAGAVAKQQQQQAPSSSSSASTTHPGATAYTLARPGWKGASGRTAIVDPVKDNPEVAPLKIPLKNSRRTPADGVDQKKLQTKKTALRIDSGGGGGSSGGGENGNMAGLSAPISPETLVIPAKGGGGAQAATTSTTTISGGRGGGGEGGKEKEKEKEKEGGGRGGEGGKITAPSSAGRSLANTLRNFIPTSSSLSSNVAGQGPKRASRLFSGGSSRNSPTPATTPTPTSDGTAANNLLWNTTAASKNNSSVVDASHGYPSPPLSGGIAGSTSPVHAQKGANNLHAPSPPAQPKIAKDRDQDGDKAVPDPQTHTLLHSPSNSTLRSHQPQQHQQQQPSIRRKEVGSAINSALLHPNTNTTTNTATSSAHRPQDSFSSSVYSNLTDDPGESNRNHSANNTGTAPPRQPPARIQLSTKDLPSLPTAGAATLDSPYVQPPSRFSITTYATSAYTTRSSPRESFDADAPPLPTPPKDIVMGTNANNSNRTNMATTASSSSTTKSTDPSVLARSRPQMRGGTNKWEDPKTADEEPVKISLSKAWMSTAGANSSGKSVQNSPPRTRKTGPQPKGPRDLVSTSRPAQPPPPSTTTTTTAAAAENNNRMLGFGFLGGPKSPAAASDTEKASSRPASILSNVDKDLPRAPAPAPASLTPTTNDRIAQLNASLQDLANRRMNIHRAIKQMTELMPQDNLIMQDAVRRKREDEKRKIEELKGKLDDIGREEHELGMKLHRAYKKLDKQTEYEPTTLWVRRATGA